MKAKSKYRAVRTVVDGISFASKKEAKRYQELNLLVAARQISHLELQEKFDLRIAGMLICRYKADFTYYKDGLIIREDVKGIRTPVYQIKAAKGHPWNRNR